jgi:holliday junction DNA helicase RuvB
MGFLKNILTELFCDLIPNNTSAKSHRFFEDIVGYDDIKELFVRALSADKPVHILLCGPPASAKSLFMQQFMKLNDSYFTLGSNSTKSGMVDALFEKRPRYLIVDEIDKMSTKDQTVLLSLMESGIISETKYKRTRKIQLETSVFATANSTTKKLLPPLLTRFCILRLQPYNKGEFREITRKVLYREEGLDGDIAGVIANAVWSRMKSANVRDCVRIGRITKSLQDVRWVVDTFLKYDSN